MNSAVIRSHKCSTYGTLALARFRGYLNAPLWSFLTINHRHLCGFAVAPPFDNYGLSVCSTPERKDEHNDAEDDKEHRVSKKDLASDCENWGAMETRRLFRDTE